MQKTYGIYSKNYIVEVDQHFPNTLKPIYHVFSTISSNNYVNLIWLMTHQSLFNSIGNNLLFILSIQTSLAIFCWQTALVDLISGHYQCSSDRGESVLLPGSSLSATEPIKTHRFLFLPDFQKSVEESLPVRILCKFLLLNTIQFSLKLIMILTQTQPTVQFNKV